MHARPTQTGVLTISVSAGPAHTLLTVAGECDIRTSADLLEALSAQVAGEESRIVLDLSALRFLDVAGTHALLAARTALDGRGGSLALAAPQPIVSRMLELTRAAHLIPVYPSVTEALAFG